MALKQSNIDLLKKNRTKQKTTVKKKKKLPKSNNLRLISHQLVWQTWDNLETKFNCMHDCSGCVDPQCPALWLVTFGSLEAKFASLIRVQLNVETSPKENYPQSNQTGLVLVNAPLKSSQTGQRGWFCIECWRNRINPENQELNVPTLGQVCNSQAPGVYTLYCSSCSNLMIKRASTPEAHRGFPVTRPSPPRSLRDDSDT